MPTIVVDIATLPAPSMGATKPRRLPRLVGLSIAAAGSLGLWYGLFAAVRFLA